MTALAEALRANRRSKGEAVHPVPTVVLTVIWFIFFHSRMR